uniref:Uncharacterized protein n=1 Tax=Chenopodium quinoa TaxID=63459 RepID=A0A803N8G7_CHEQI
MGLAEKLDTDEDDEIDYPVPACMYAYDKEARLQRIRAYIDLINGAKPEELLHIFSAESALELEDPLSIKYNMAEQTLKELGAPKTGEDPLYIVFSEL